MTSAMKLQAFLLPLRVPSLPPPPSPHLPTRLPQAAC